MVLVKPARTVDHSSFGRDVTQKFLAIGKSRENEGANGLSVGTRPPNTPGGLTCLGNA